MTEKKKNKSRISWPLLFGVFATTAAGGAAVYFIKGFLESEPSPPKQVIQQVQLMRPPPPPPPKEEIEPPPPPEIEEEVDLPEPEMVEEMPADDLPPPSDILGLDADGVAGADGFGLQARRGGRDLLASGSGSRFNWYAGVLKDDLLDFLSQYRELRERAYDIRLRLWLNGDGSVSRVSLRNSTGDPDLDRELESRLAGLSQVTESPPEDLPQPVQIRLVSRL